MATSPPLSSLSLSSNAHFSAYTNGHAPAKPRTSNASSNSRQDKTYPASITSGSTPEVHINGRPRHSRPSTSSASASTHTHDETTWGSHFWVTLVDPQSQVSFFACPATGQVSWDPPVGNFVLPPSENGEWWEIGDESRGGIPYYYHTKSGETVWEKPDGFVIPLTVLQSFTSTTDQTPPPHTVGQEPRPTVPHSRSYKKEVRGPVQAPGPSSVLCEWPDCPYEEKPECSANASQSHLPTPIFQHQSRLAPALPPIPGSEASTPPTPTHSHRSFIPPRSPPQSLGVAVERLTRTPPQSPDTPSSVSKVSSESGYVSAPESTRVKPKLKIEAPVQNGASRAPMRPMPSTPTKGPTVAGKEIGRPVLNMNATLQLSPVKARAARTPIFVDAPPTTRACSAHPILPQDLASDIQQFVESEFAQQYFATHRTGFIFKRKVPRGPLTTPLLNLSRPLHKDAVRVFRAVQRLMGDSEKGATAGSNTPRLEEARWLLGEGLANGELRDEVYCQVMKQLDKQSKCVMDSTFRGWQLLCVLLVTFPPSKNFEPYLHAFLSQHTGMTQGRVDRLAAIAKKGPRGKPPSLAEIETASDAAFNPSTFGEPLDAVFRLQERTYPTQRVPIVLPFLADGVLATRRDKVAALKMRLDRGSYTLEGVDDPHVPASLFKLWLRELMYNDCIARAVRRLSGYRPANRRVVLFVISFLQLFLDERVLAATKMTSANLALVMAPNLLRCGSDSMAIVFNNAQYEQAFIDPQYVPQHGLGAVPSAAPRASKSRNRRAHS
ncbi:MyTH4 domain-containing protein [Lactarius indigo]|nr:MyTH4 domain-containing protein [Lactarius indigo]